MVSSHNPDLLQRSTPTCETWRKEQKNIDIFTGFQHVTTQRNTTHNASSLRQQLIQKRFRKK